MNQLTEDDLSMLSWTWLGVGALMVIITVAFPEVIRVCGVERAWALCVGFSLVWVGIVGEAIRMVTPWEE